MKTKERSSLFSTENIFFENFPELLKPFENSKKWESLSPYEKSLLSELFFQRGKREFLSQNKNALSSFELALHYCSDTEQYLKQAYFFLDKQKKGTENFLFCAQEKLQDLLKQCPNHKEALQALAEVNIQLAYTFEDSQYFEKALEALDCIESLDLGKKEQPYLDWLKAKINLAFSLESTESCDLFQALHLIEKAQSLSSEPGFLRDYADIYFQLFRRLSKQPYLFQAIDFYEKSLSIFSEDFTVLLKVSEAYTYLYKITASADDFLKADDYFFRSSRFCLDGPMLYMCWSELFLLAAQIHQCGSKLKQSEKLLKTGSKVNTESMEAQLLEGRILLTKGGLEQDIIFLKKAYKIFSSIAGRQRYNQVLWVSLAQCLMEQGKYFSDERFFWQAVEKLSYASSLVEDARVFYPFFARAYYSIALYEEDVLYLKRAFQYGKEALDYDSVEPLTWALLAMILSKWGQWTQDLYYLELACDKFEQAHALREEFCLSDKSWLCEYGYTLGMIGDYLEQEDYYTKMIEILSHVLALDPKDVDARYHLAVGYSHLASLNCQLEHFYLSMDHFRFLVDLDPEDDSAFNDWAIAYLLFAEVLKESEEAQSEEELLYLYELAEEKLQRAVCLGNREAYYNLACLCSLMHRFDEALFYLQRSNDLGALPDLEQLLCDEWMSPFRQTPLFKIFVNQLKKT